MPAPGVSSTADVPPVRADALRSSGRDYARAAQGLRRLHREGGEAEANSCGTFQLTCHPHIIGYRSRIRIIDELIRHAKSKPGVWFGTHAEVAAWARDNAA